MEEETKKDVEIKSQEILNNNLLDDNPKQINEENENEILDENQQIIEETEKENLDGNTQTLITLPRKMRWIVFALLIYLCIVMEFDQGVLSSTTDSLAKDLDLNDKQLGGLGSMIFLGKAIGCLVFFSIINKFNRKYIQLITCFITLLSLFLTTQIKNLVLLYICRVAVGFATSYLGIFAPVWGDQFGIHKYKSILLTCHHLSSSVGYLFGYGLGTWLGWTFCFYIQIALLIVPTIILFFINNKYFSMSLMPIKSKMQLLEETKKANNKKDKEDEKIEKEINKINGDMLDESLKLKEEKEENILDKDNNNNEEDKNKDKEEKIDLQDDISLFEDIQQQGENMSKGSIIRQIKALAKSPMFILINITLCSIYLIVSAIQFWISDYIQYALHIEEPHTRFLMLGAVIITSPPLGMVVGGIILTKLGGYDSEKAIYIPLVSSLAASIFGNLCPISPSAYVFLPLFWLYFFAGSGIIPSANGICLVSVEKKYAGAASSISILLYNVLGRFPGPNLYAFFKSLVNDNSSRVPMWLLLNVSVIGFLSILIGLIFNKRRYKKLREELLNKEENENNNENINDEIGEKINDDKNSNDKENIDDTAENDIKKENEEKVIFNNDSNDNLIEIDDNNNINNNGKENIDDKKNVDDKLKVDDKENKESINHEEKIDDKEINVENSEKIKSEKESNIEKT